MEFLSEYGMFLIKTITIVVAIIAAAGGLIAVSMRGQTAHKERLEVKHLNRHYEDLAYALQAVMLHKKAFKQVARKLKKRHKSEQKGEHNHSRRLFVLNFNGDLRGSAVNSLREEITAILTVAKPEDEVLVRLESSGGLVHAYGLAASQLQRLRDKSLKLTVAVDKVAASGGYLMACVAERIIAAPFAVIGSIGVIAQFPNFNRLLKKNEIDFELFTAGEYKRTMTLFGENTEQGREKFREEIEDVHVLFKEFVQTHRPTLDIAQVATGEHWYGQRALELNLVDELRTSDDYLLEASQTANLYQVTYTGKKTWVERLLTSSETRLNNAGLATSPGELIQ